MATIYISDIGWIPLVATQKSIRFNMRINQEFCHFLLIFSLGVVLCSMIDLKAVGRSPYLVVLDATTFEELARAEIPVDIPFGIHGIFIPEIK